MGDEQQRDEQQQGKWWDGPLTQQQANYTPLSMARGRACANCRWLKTRTYYGDQTSAHECHLVSSYPRDILPTGLCDRWEAIVVADLKPEPLEVVIVQPEEDDDSSAERSSSVPLGERLKTVLAGLFRREAQSEADADAFEVFKGADGRTYWVARHTNIFEDRDKEILSEAAHDDYVARVEAGFVPMPELWSWHTKGSRHGVAQTVFKHAGFVFAVGTFDDTSAAQQAIRYYRKHRGRIRLSHGFTFPAWAQKDGVYESYNTFEISTLPEGVESNPYTTFEEVVDMTITQQQREYLEKTLGKEAAERILAQAEKDTETLKALGVKYKDFVTVSGATTADSSAGSDGDAAAVVLKMLGDLVEGHGTTVALLSALEARISAFEATESANKTSATARIDAVEKLLSEMQAALRLQPRASQADATQVSDDTAKHIKSRFGDDLDPFFGDLGVPAG